MSKVFTIIYGLVSAMLCVGVGILITFKLVQARNVNKHNLEVPYTAPNGWTVTTDIMATTNSRVCLYIVTTPDGQQFIVVSGGGVAIHPYSPKTHEVEKQQ